MSFIKGFHKETGKSLANDFSKIFHKKIGKFIQHFYNCSIGAGGNFTDIN